MRKRSKFELIYQDLHDQIRTGRLKPGQSLPPEIVLAKNYRVAVLTLRRALARLRDEGLITSRPYHGTKVCMPSRHSHASRLPQPARNIGIFAPLPANAMTHPVFSRVVNGLEGAVSSAGYAMEVLHYDSSVPGRENAFLRQVSQSAAQGWLVPISLPQSVRELLKKRNIPTVIFHRPDDSLSGHVYEIDYADLTRKLVQHLEEQGCRQIWFLVPDDMRIWAEHIVECAVHSRSSCVLSLHEAEAYTVEAGRAATEKLLSAGKPVDAVICADDEIAAGALLALKHRKSRSAWTGVIGGGDFPLGMLTEPKLTTIAYPYYQIGREAGRLLIDLIEGVNIQPAHRKILPRLIVRESSQRPQTVARRRKLSMSGKA